MSPSLRWPAAIGGSILLLVTLVVAEVEGPARLIAAFWFLLVCTGMSFVPLMRLGPAPARLAVCLALSAAIDTAVTTALLAAGGYSVTASVALLGTVCGVGCGLQIREWARTHHRTEVRVHA